MAQIQTLDDCKISDELLTTGRQAYAKVRIEWSTAKTMQENGRTHFKITPENLANVIKGFYGTLKRQDSPLAPHWNSFYDQTIQISSDDIITAENILGSDSKEKYKKGSKVDRALWLTLTTYYSLFTHVSEQYSPLEVGIAAASSLTAHRRQHSNKPERGDASIEMKEDSEWRLDATTLEQYCRQSAVFSQLWSDIQRNEETLQLLVSEGLWNDIQIIIDSVNIPKQLQPYFKAFLIKLKRSSIRNTNPLSSNVDRNSDLSAITNELAGMDLNDA